MPTRGTATIEEIRVALVDLAICASPFINGRGMAGLRRKLLGSVVRANKLMNAEIIDPLAEAERVEHLRHMADTADIECAARPGYRADLEG